MVPLRQGLLPLCSMDKGKIPFALVGLCVADDHFLSGQEAGFVPPFLALLPLSLRDVM